MYDADVLVGCGPQHAAARVLWPALPRGGSGQSCARSSASVMGCTRSVCRATHLSDLSGSLAPENQGTLGPSLALECKCAFGAKIIENRRVLFAGDDLENIVFL